MNRVHQIIFFISLLCLLGCGKILSIVTKDPDTEGKTNVKSKYNFDNVIFTQNKTYTYLVSQKNKTQDIDFELTLQTIPGDYNRESKIKYKYYYTEESFSDSIMKSYIDTLKNHIWEITSVDESNLNVTLHPPRSYSLRELELAPFPSIQLPPKLNQTWETSLWVGPGWGEYSYKTIRNKYEVIKLDFINENDFTAIINAVSTSELGSSGMLFEFDSSKGFTSIEYNLPNESKVTLKMKTNTNTM